jgi:hypothetical protein
MIMTLINIILMVIFWNMGTAAAEDGRFGWGYAYLFCSAMNGAAAAASIF